ncbi:hypothetical protein [Zavarzinella formosa]|uniref:hypothetical protein n=1 Tax=Zavarzinella formosa TaxID=360055 RepID=UPI0012F758C8|nr:hypothetical protein [Zavarzinella formosa]
MRRVLTAMVFGLAAVAGAAPAPKVASADRVVANPSKDIVVVTDRDESVKDFFRRQRMVVGATSVEKGVTADFPHLGDVLEADKPVTVFVSLPAWNDDESLQFYATRLRIAPPAAAVVKLFKDRKGDSRVEAVFRRDADGLHHLVGYATRRLDFYRDAKANETDGFGPADLKFGPEKK